MEAFLNDLAQEPCELHRLRPGVCTDPKTRPGELGARQVRLLLLLLLLLLLPPRLSAVNRRTETLKLELGRNMH